MRDFFFLWRLSGINFVVSRDHFRAAAAEARDFANAFGGGLVAFGEKFPQQFVEANQAHLRFFERGEMEQIAEFFLVATFGIRARGPHHAHARFFENADDVIRPRFSLFRRDARSTAANLLDFGRR